MARPRSSRPAVSRVRAPGVFLCLLALLFSSPRSARAALSSQCLWRNAKQDTLAMSHGDVMIFFLSQAAVFFCEQPSGRRAKSRGACSSHNPAAAVTVACRRRRALAAPKKDVSGRSVTSLTQKIAQKMFLGLESVLRFHRGAK